MPTGPLKTGLLKVWERIKMGASAAGRARQRRCLRHQVRMQPWQWPRNWNSVVGFGNNCCNTFTGNVLLPSAGLSFGALPDVFLRALGVLRSINWSEPWRPGLRYHPRGDASLTIEVVPAAGAHPPDLSEWSRWCRKPSICGGARGRGGFARGF